MIMDLAALGLAVLALICIAVGQLLNRKGQARFAELQHALAAYARLEGRPDAAERHEARAAAAARHTWPFKVTHQTTVAVPGGLLHMDRTPTDEELERLKAAWTDRHGSYPVTVIRPYPPERGEAPYPTIGIETTTDTGLAWRQLRKRLARPFRRRDGR